MKHRKETALANMQIARRRTKRLGHELGNFRWERFNGVYEASCKLCGDYAWVRKGPVDEFMESASAIRGTAVKAWRSVRDAKCFCPGVEWRREERKKWKARVATLRRIFARKGIDGVIAHVEGPYPMT